MCKNDSDHDIFPAPFQEICHVLLHAGKFPTVLILKSQEEKAFGGSFKII